MRVKQTLIRLLAVAVAIAVLGSAAGAGDIADDIEPLAVPNPPGVVCDTTHGPYYDHLLVVVWNVSNATYYEVYRALSAGGTRSYLGRASYYDYYRSTYYDSNVTTFQTYYYWAKACNASGCSTWGTGGACQLDTYPAPTNVQASKGQFEKRVEITWEDNSNAEVGYIIRRSGDSCGQTLDNCFSFVDTSAGCGQVTSEKAGVRDQRLCQGLMRACTRVHTACNAGTAQQDSGLPLRGWPSGQQNIKDLTCSGL